MDNKKNLTVENDYGKIFPKANTHKALMIARMGRSVPKKYADEVIYPTSPERARSKKYDKSPMSGTIKLPASAKVNVIDMFVNDNIQMMQHTPGKNKPRILSRSTMGGDASTALTTDPDTRN